MKKAFPILLMVLGLVFAGAGVYTMVRGFDAKDEVKHELHRPGHQDHSRRCRSSSASPPVCRSTAHTAPRRWPRSSTTTRSRHPAA